MIRLFSLLISLSVLTAFSQETKKVLFLGNSYTAYNSLPQLVNNVANSVGDTVIFDSNTPGGHRFLNHAVNATTLSKIASQNWDFVSLQAQSQEPSWSDAQVASEVFPYAEILVDSIKSNNECTMPLFFMTWGRENGDSFNCASWPPVCTYEGMDSILAQNYQIMANDNNGIVSPVGAVWKYIRENWPTIDLYAADGSHPSPAGSFAAACCFYTVIFEKDPILTSYNFSISQADADTIRKATQIIVFDSLSKWNIGKYDPVADFNQTSNSLSITLTNASSNSTNYSWDFGDSNYSSDENPTHTFLSGGNYEICLVASDNCGNSDSIYSTISLGCSEPISSFTYATNDLNITLTNTSTNFDSLLWSIGDTNSNVNFTFDSVGVYEICLFSYNSCGYDSSCQDISVICTFPVASFNYTSDSTTMGFTFNNISSNADSILWLFGDGQFSNEDSTYHSYAGSGTYDVGLIAYNDCGSDTNYASVIVDNSTNSELLHYCVNNMKINGLNNQIQVNYNCNPILYDSKVFDITGRLITYRQNLFENEIIATNLKPGIYILSIESDSFKWSNKVVVTD